MTEQAIRDVWCAREASLQTEIQRQTSRYNLISWLRLVVFLAGAVVVYLCWSVSTGWAIGLGAGVLVFFLYLIRYHAGISEELNLMRRMATICQYEIRSLGGDRSGGVTGEGYGSSQHPYAADLDLFGRGGMFELICRTATSMGRDRLAQWLLQPLYTPADIRGRQQAVMSLAALPDQGVTFQALGQAEDPGEQRLQELTGWGLPPIPRVEILRVLSWVMPALTLAASIAGFVGWISWLPGTLLLLFNLSLAAAYMSLTRQVQARLDQLAPTVRRIQRLVVNITERDYPDLAPRQRLDQAPRALEALSELGAAFDLRLNAVAVLLLNGLLLWDIRCLLRTADWHQSWHPKLAPWLDALADWDALLSLARYTATHPAYVWPDVVSEGTLYEAENLGHPLLRPAGRVDNPLHLPTPGSLYLITGANMAGKSTYLRAVGVNLVLAMCGAPVCASRMQFVPMPVFTCMRATDSLADHASYFFAELNRLRQLMDLLEQQQPVMVILDEILRGTNSHDKQTGSMGLIRRLVRMGACGLAATHDLALGSLADELPGRVILKRFEVDIQGDELTFDYLLRDGLAQHLNATYLMRRMGLLEEQAAEA
ncbi:MAG: hypothetical protein SF053_02915 [Bacteroidia bacterium]|nr:hypothetical protein [Bacteroidia bacterium]